MKVGDLVKVERAQASTPNYNYKKGKDPTVALVVEKYDVGEYWKVQCLGGVGCLLVIEEDVEVISNGC